MISDRELWAIAHHVLDEHADKASVFVAERIGALSVAGDLEGVATWKAIAGRMDQLRDYGDARPISPQ